MSIARNQDGATSPDVSPRETGASTYLRKISDALGCSIQDLVADGRPLKHSGQVELLRLWSLLPDDAARKQVLDVARTLSVVGGATSAELDGSLAVGRSAGE